MKLGEILTKAHGNLKEIGVSSPEADALVETALEHGALGAKMSGGGLGGCIIALVANVSQAQELAERLEDERSCSDMDRKACNSTFLCQYCYY